MFSLDNCFDKALSMKPGFVLIKHYTLNYYRHYIITSHHEKCPIVEITHLNSKYITSSMIELVCIQLRLGSMYQLDVIIKVFG